MNYYERHLGDYAKDTAHLTMIEHGAYCLLLDRYYAREEPLPAEISECCRLVRVTRAKETKAIQAVLKEFFTLKPDGWHIERCDREISKYRATISRIRALRDCDSYRRFRTLVMERDGEKCTYCGAVDVNLQLDHIIPQSRGGSDDPENLTPACRTCNTSKGAKMLSEWLK
jgi:uncharacterized protein YdaU (DUF1376 family)